MRKETLFLLHIIFCLCFLPWQWVTAATWNNPHAGPLKQNTGYGAFVSAPKTLDPAKAYSSDEIQFIAQIYEPPLQYSYLKRPYELIPLTATQIPQVHFYDAQDQLLPSNTAANNIAYSVYDIFIQPGIYYQPHPALKHRELTADDYVYQIKRLADPRIQSPIYGVMSGYILGFEKFAHTLQQMKNPEDLRTVPLDGVKIIDQYHYQIKLRGFYPQFPYWLAMTFFAPIPWEVDLYYKQHSTKEKNLSFDWVPVGTGPYSLIKNDPNREMILERNPNFHTELYPSIGTDEDHQKGYLINAGKKMPFVDRFIFSLDKESIPRWNKFLQGYYDTSGISADSFDQAIKLDENGHPQLTSTLQNKKIRLRTSIYPGLFYMGFNMLNPKVGGYGEKQQKLRQAISIAIDYEEFIAIFLNGRGLPAQGPIPPSIFGYQKDNINTYIYFRENNHIKRKSLATAKQLLAQAGYPNGINPKTGKALILNYDVATTGTPDDKTQLEWMRKQFAKLGIQLNIRNTDYNRFQEKVRTGNAEIFSWGWHADYPDPENFLFLLYGPNSKVKFGGENAANYNNAKANQLFEEIKILPNGIERQEKINEFLSIVRKDNPWIWGFYPVTFALSQQWVQPMKTNTIINNILKYEQIDTSLRAQLQKKWNHPSLWPIVLLISLIVLFCIPLLVIYWKREYHSTIRRKKLTK